jgi:hypothetical protein
LSGAERRAKWVRYVKAMVSHYGGRVKHWTISDEAHDVRQKSYKRDCWTNETEYAEWHRAGYDAIKAVDPEAKVILNVWPEFAHRLLEKLGTGKLDILAANAYHVPVPYLTRMNLVAEQFGIRQRWAPGISLPPYSLYLGHYEPGKVSETGIGDRTWSAVNTRLAEAVITTFSLGYERFFHYTATYVGNTNWPSLFEADSGLKPYAAQLGALAWLLDGFTRADPVPTGNLERRLKVVRFTKRDETAMFAIWGAPAKAQRLLLPMAPGEGFALFDHFSNPLPLSEIEKQLELRLGPHPIFLEVPAKSADALTHAFQGAEHFAPLPSAD